MAMTHHEQLPIESVVCVLRDAVRRADAAAAMRYVRELYRSGPSHGAARRALCELMLAAVEDIGPKNYAYIVALNSPRTLRAIDAAPTAVGAVPLPEHAAVIDGCAVMLCRGERSTRVYDVVRACIEDREACTRPLSSERIHMLSVDYGQVLALGNVYSSCRFVAHMLHAPYADGRAPDVMAVARAMWKQTVAESRRRGGDRTPLALFVESLHRAFVFVGNDVVFLYAAAMAVTTPEEWGIVPDMDAAQLLQAYNDGVQASGYTTESVTAMYARPFNREAYAADVARHQPRPTYAAAAAALQYTPAAAPSTAAAFARLVNATRARDPVGYAADRRAAARAAAAVPLVFASSSGGGGGGGAAFLKRSVTDAPAPPMPSAKRPQIQMLAPPAPLVRDADDVFLHAVFTRRPVRDAEEPTPFCAMMTPSSGAPLMQVVVYGPFMGADAGRNALDMLASDRLKTAIADEHLVAARWSTVVRDVTPLGGGGDGGAATYFVVDDPYARMTSGTTARIDAEETYIFDEERARSRFCVALRPQAPLVALLDGAGVDGSERHTAAWLSFFSALLFRYVFRCDDVRAADDAVYDDSLAYDLQTCTVRSYAEYRFGCATTTRRYAWPLPTPAERARVAALLERHASALVAKTQRWADVIDGCADARTATRAPLTDFAARCRRTDLVAILKMMFQ